MEKTSQVPARGGGGATAQASTGASLIGRIPRTPANQMKPRRTPPPSQSAPAMPLIIDQMAPFPIARQLMQIRFS